MCRNSTCHCPDTGYRNKFKFATVIETQQLRAPRIETTIAVHISGSQSTTHCKDINIHAVSATEHHQENPLRVHIATDHAGLETSQYLIEQLTAAGYDMIDHGPKSTIRWMITQVSALTPPLPLNETVIRVLTHWASS